MRFLNEDLFEAKISDATVVTLYLLNTLNLKLLPKLLNDLKPGTRVVSHAFDIGQLEAAANTHHRWTVNLFLDDSGEGHPGTQRGAGRGGCKPVGKQAPQRTQKRLA